MNVLFLTPYFPPEVGAPQTRIYELAVRLQKRGHKVRILTGFPNYPDGIVSEGYRRKICMKEKKDDIEIRRVWIYPVPNRGFFRRILNHLSFMFSSSFFGIFLSGRPDVIVVESPPLFDGIAGWFLGRMNSKPFVFNIADFWPESAVALGSLRDPVLIRLSGFLEKRIYAVAEKIAVVTPGMKEKLVARGIPGNKVEVLTNATDTGFFKFDPARPWRKKLGENRFIVLYAGTLGIAHGLEIMLRAAENLKPQKDILFVLAGGGAEREKLLKMKEKFGLENVIFVPGQPKAEMPSLLSSADACVISLRKLEIFRNALPSKMFEAMACSRPLIAAVEGEAAEVIKDANAGICVEPENPEAMSQAVLKLYRERSSLQKFSSAREYVEKHFSRDTLVNKWEEVLKKCLKS